MNFPTEPKRRGPKKAAANETQNRKYQCDYDGCTRAFTRSEHLQRHLLNHTAGVNTCERCRAHFKRKDLLERHLARHRQKDEVAGAEGQGVLNTRKRLWKNEYGDIVTKRPTLENHDQQNPSSRSSEAADTTQRFNTEAPISPPTSSYPSDASSHANNSAPKRILYANDALNTPSLEFDSYSLPNYIATDQGGAWPNTADNFTYMPINDTPFDEVFNADTVSSFNMPFTTMNNYNWLFDAKLSSTDFSIPNSMPFLTDQMTTVESESSSSLLGPPFGGNYTPPESTTNSWPTNRAFSNGFQSAQPNQNLDSETSTNDSNQRAPVATSAPEQNEFAINNTPIMPPSDGACGAESSDKVERPLSILQKSNRLPIIDELARSRMLDLISNAKPIGPDGNVISKDHPLLSLGSLQTFCDLYFTHFNATYPLLHQAAFDASAVDTLLLIAVLLLGATYGDREAHSLAVCIHDILRPQIFSSPAFTARPELWVLQTILLVESFGKSRAGRKQHDMAHMFQGMLINLIRRSDFASIKIPRDDDGLEDLEERWRHWAEAEQKKRVAFLCFMWDTQHAVLFSQSLCMSAFELRSTLPCDQALWEAPSAQDWYQLRNKHPCQPLFLSCMKSYLTPSPSATQKPSNAFSRAILFHGLMSISWDMKRRDQTSLGLMGQDKVLGNWKTRLAKAYDAWKFDFDIYCRQYEDMCSPSNREARMEFACFVTAQNAIYHSAHIILNAELLDLQIHAGARHILGRPVTRHDHDRSKSVIKRWLSEDFESASRAAWHSAQILRSASRNLDNYDFKGLFAFPWCLYIATLTCWAFYHSRHGDDDDEPTWDAKAEMNELLDAMVTETPDDLVKLAGKRRTRALIAVIVKQLEKVRWAIVHDGMAVLNGLVTWRLINQPETCVTEETFRGL